MIDDKEHSEMSDEMEDRMMTELEFAYREGYDAYLYNLGKEHNPFDGSAIIPNEQSELYEAWKRGYEDAQWDD